ncbi:MAG: hypothetical protein RIM99_00030 [Cyclobacteriaceae bacterium]
MKKLFYTSIVLLFVSCQFEDDNAPKPTDEFIKYIGALADHEAKDIEPLYADDGTTLEGFVIFGTQQQQDLTVDYYVAITDASGNLINDASFDASGFIFGDINGNGIINQQDSVNSQESAGQIEVLSNGFLITGTSSFTQNLLGANEYQFITYAFLDQNLSATSTGLIRADTSRNISGLQNVTRDMIANDMISLSDGTFLLIGAKENAAETDLDFYIRKFDQTTIYWEKSIGFGSGDDVLVRAFENDDQSIALFGYSNDPGINGSAGINATYVLVNQNGNILDSNSNGILEANAIDVNDDVLTDVIETSGGYAVVGTSTRSSSEQSFSFFMSMNKNGVAQFSDIISSRFVEAEASIQSKALALTQTTSNEFVVVGEYPSFRVGAENKGGEAMFVGVDQVGNPIQGLESNFGLEGGNDVANDAITLPDGKIVVACTIDFGVGVKLISLMKLNDSGSLDR